MSSEKSRENSELCMRFIKSASRSNTVCLLSTIFGSIIARSGQGVTFFVARRAMIEESSFSGGIYSCSYQSFEAMHNDSATA